MILELPFPPTVNTYWGTRVTGGGKRAFVQRYINHPGKKFRQAVMDECLVRRAGVGLAGPLSCVVDLYPPDARRRDCDNYGKALLDALGHAGVYGDDSQIRDLRIRMHPKQSPGRCVVELQPLEGQQQTEHSQMGLGVING